MTTTIQTKYGNASIDAQGYYTIHSNEKGNRGKKLHRLIFEDFYKIKLPKHIDIHHLDHDRTNNNIWNLIPLTHAEHSAIHTCEHTEEFKKRLSEKMTGENSPFYGTKNSIKTMLKKSNTLNSTGYFRVIKIKKEGTKQGFLWAYNYYDENNKRHRITSTNLEKLKEKVLAKGLEWYKLSEVENDSEN
jgi:hypothetical protein